MYIYIYICIIYQEMSWSDYPILGAELAKVMKRFQHPLLTSKAAAVRKNTQTIFTRNDHKVMGLSRL